MFAALLAATLWMWDFPCGEPLDYFRVRQVHVYQIGIEEGMDDEGNPIEMPIYIPWLPMTIQESLETMALVLCEPGLGELCAIEVKAVDLAGNLDKEEEAVCEP